MKGGYKMFKINDNYLKLPGSYLFSTIAKKVAAYSEANPGKAGNIIRLGIGKAFSPHERAGCPLRRRHTAVWACPAHLL